jgi:hypothetical protein
MIPVYFALAALTVTAVVFVALTAPITFVAFVIGPAALLSSRRGGQCE